MASYPAYTLTLREVQGSHSNEVEQAGILWTRVQLSTFASPREGSRERGHSLAQQCQAAHAHPSDVEMAIQGGTAVADRLSMKRWGGLLADLALVPPVPQLEAWGRSLVSSRFLSGPLHSPRKGRGHRLIRLNRLWASQGAGPTWPVSKGLIF